MAARKKRAARRSPPVRKGRGLSRAKPSKKSAPKKITKSARKKSAPKRARKESPEKKIAKLEKKIREYATIKYRKPRYVTDEVARSQIIVTLKKTKIRIPKDAGKAEEARKKILDEQASRARDLSRDLAALTALRHPGKEKYRDRHFIATYTGKEYVVDPNDKKSKIVIKKSTYGSGADASVSKVAADFDRRLKGVLEGSTAGGSYEDPRVKAAGYGVFREGPAQIEMSIYQRDPKPAKRKITKRKKTTKRKK